MLNNRLVAPIVAALSCSLVVCSFAHAATPQQKNLLLRHLDGTGLLQSKKLFDGRNMVKGTNFLGFDKYTRRFNAACDQAVNAWNGLPKKLQADPDMGKLARRLQGKVAYRKALLTAHGIELKRHKAQQAAGSTPASTAGEAATPQQKNLVLRHLDSMRMFESKKPFDGKSMVSNTKFTTFDKYARGFNDTYIKAVNAWNGLPKKLQADPGMHPVLKKLQAKGAYRKVLLASWQLELKRHKATAAARNVIARGAKRRTTSTSRGGRRAAPTYPAGSFDNAGQLALCSKFNNLVRDAWKPMATLLGRRRLFNGKPGSKPQEIAKWMTTVAAACKRAEFAPVAKYGCTKDCKGIGKSKTCVVVPNRQKAEFRGRHYPEWCENALNWKAVLGKTIANELQDEMQFFEKRPHRKMRPGKQAYFLFYFITPNSVGWLQKNKYWSELSYSEEIKKRLVENLTERYKGLDLKVTHDDNKLKPVKKAFDDLRDVINAEVGKWPIPKAGKKNYGIKLATSDLKGWLKGVKVKKAFAKNKSWYVHSKYGKPYRRTWGGYVFYKIKGEPHCQLRSYTLEEMYKGGGRYQKAKRIEWGWNRYQKCK